MTLRCEYNETGKLKLDLIDEDGEVVAPENYSIDDKATIATMSQAMIPEIVNSVFNLCNNTEVQFGTSVLFLAMTDKILHDMEKRIKNSVEDTLLKKPGAVKIAIDKNALREALRKEKEERDRKNNDGE